MPLITSGGLILLTMTIGPIGAVPYAIDRGLSIVQATVVVCSVNVALVPMWFGIMEVFGYSKRYHKYLANRALKYVSRRSAEFQRNLQVCVAEFERRLGHIGFFIGLTVFSFIFGVVWPSIGAYFLNIKRVPALISISIGAIGNAILFGLAAVGMLQFVPSPRALYIGLMMLTVAFLFYGKLREIRVLRSIVRRLERRRGSDYSSSSSS
ncbi:MAG: small multi-drug export protein [Candidatus Hodarchaeaceae archaeon]|nr:small multi-drug export protein [Candidatus Hodarchaeaceae archaeon]